MSKEVYKIVDDELNHLHKSKETCISFEIYTAKGQQALSLIEDYKLIKCRSDNWNGGKADITLLGEKVINIGGIEKYIKKLELKENWKYLQTKLDVVSKPILLIISIITIVWNIYSSRANESLQKEVTQSTESLKKDLYNQENEYTKKLQKLTLEVQSLKNLEKKDTTCATFLK